MKYGLSVIARAPRTSGIIYSHTLSIQTAPSGHIVGKPCGLYTALATLYSAPHNDPPSLVQRIVVWQLRPRGKQTFAAVFKLLFENFLVPSPRVASQPVAAAAVLLTSRTMALFVSFRGRKRRTRRPVVGHGKGRAATERWFSTKKGVNASTK